MGNPFGNRSGLAPGAGLCLSSGLALVVAPRGGERSFRVLEVGTYEPVELLELAGLADQHVLADQIEVVECLDGLAVFRDDTLVDDVEGTEMLGHGGPADRVVVPGPVLRHIAG